MSKRNKPKGKRINPTYWVPCEGKTEEAYVSFLRSKYRLPIVISSKLSGSNIHEKFIKKSKEGKPIHSKDKNFLIYDGDVSSLVNQLQKIEGAVVVISNPSIELWFLYHYKNQKSEISSAECLRELSNRNKNQYKKGVIDSKLKEKLDTCNEKACERAKDSQHLKNPSSNLYILIDELEKVKIEE